jgi:hypothetical protein
MYALSRSFSKTSCWNDIVYDSIELYALTFNMMTYMKKRATKKNPRGRGIVANIIQAVTGVG